MRAVIFDMDGVLIDSMKYHIYSWQKAFEKFGIKTTYRELSLFEGMSFKETIKIISKNNNIKLSQEDIDSIYSEKKKILSEILEFEVYDKIRDILTFLKGKKLKLGVVTGSNKEFTNKIINNYFEELFDIVITGDDIKNGKSKPHPAPYEKAIEKLGLNKEDIIVVENAPLGIKSAKAADLRVIALETTLKEKELKEADIVLNNHTQLYNYIKKEI